MGKKREFDIAFVGLKPGIHEFNYEVDNQFFESFSEQDFKDCHAFVKVTLDKSNSLLLLKFDIDGKVEVTCDRCGDPLELTLWDEFNLVIKQVENPDEMNDSEDDPDIFYISRTESHLHLATWIYEFVLLSIPNQRVCGEDENGESKCNKKVLAMLEEMKKRSLESNHPLQKGLEQFKKNNN